MCTSCAWSLMSEHASADVLWSSSKLTQFTKTASRLSFINFGRNSFTDCLRILLPNWIIQIISILWIIQFGSRVWKIIPTKQALTKLSTNHHGDKTLICVRKFLVYYKIMNTNQQIKTVRKSMEKNGSTCPISQMLPSWDIFRSFTHNLMAEKILSLRDEIISGLCCSSYSQITVVNGHNPFIFFQNLVLCKHWL